MLPLALALTRASCMHHVTSHGGQVPTQQRHLCLQVSKLTGSSGSSNSTTAGPGSPVWQLLQAMDVRLLSRAAMRMLNVPSTLTGQQQLLAARQLAQLLRASLPSLQRLLYHQLGPEGYVAVEGHMGQRAAQLSCSVSAACCVMCDVVLCCGCVMCGSKEIPCNCLHHHM